MEIPATPPNASMSTPATSTTVNASSAVSAVARQEAAGLILTVPAYVQSAQPVSTQGAAPPAQTTAPVPSSPASSAAPPPSTTQPMPPVRNMSTATAAQGAVPTGYLLELTLNTTRPTPVSTTVPQITPQTLRLLTQGQVVRMLAQSPVPVAPGSVLQLRVSAGASPHITHIEPPILLPQALRTLIGRALSSQGSPAPLLQLLQDTVAQPARMASFPGEVREVARQLLAMLPDPTSLREPGKLADFVQKSGLFHESALAKVAREVLAGGTGDSRLTDTPDITGRQGGRRASPESANGLPSTASPASAGGSASPSAGSMPANYKGLLLQLQQLLEGLRAAPGSGSSATGTSSAGGTSSASTSIPSPVSAVPGQAQDAHNASIPTSNGPRLETKAASLAPTVVAQGAGSPAVGEAKPVNVLPGHPPLSLPRSSLPSADMSGPGKVTQAPPQNTVTTGEGVEPGKNPKPSLDAKLSTSEKRPSGESLARSENFSPQDKLSANGRLSASEKLLPNEKASFVEKLSMDEKLSTHQKLSTSDKASPHENVASNEKDSLPEKRSSNPTLPMDEKLSFNDKPLVNDKSTPSEKPGSNTKAQATDARLGSTESDSSVTTEPEETSSADPTQTRLQIRTARAAGQYHRMEQLTRPPAAQQPASGGDEGASEATSLSWSDALTEMDIPGVGFPLPHRQRTNADKAGDSMDALVGLLLKRSQEALNRLHLHQLSHAGATARDAPQQPQNPPLTFDLPIFMQGQVHVFNTRIDEEELSAPEPGHPNKKIRQWSVSLGFDIEGLGPMFCQLNMTEQRANLQFWADRPATLALTRTHLGFLSKNLNDLGVTVGEVGCHEGMPKQTHTRLSQQLVDIKT